MRLERAQRQGSDIFWRLFQRSPISEVFFALQKLAWPFFTILLLNGDGGWRQRQLPGSQTAKARPDHRVQSRRKGQAAAFSIELEFDHKNL